MFLFFYERVSNIFTYFSTYSRYRGSSRGDREVREKTRSKERERGNAGNERDYRESDRYVNIGVI